MHPAPAEPVHRHRQCQNAQVMLQDHQIYKTKFKLLIYFYTLACVPLTLFSVFLVVVVFYFILELKKHCLLCRLVVKDDQEEEFQQLDPEVRQFLICFMLQ